ncbi:hypothetical protein JTB14_024473 [Gonioctena quinquepunctata]|nr:hypothetical protein JTB14_024473 [Gonioctena quinquepunctata]
MDSKSLDIKQEMCEEVNPELVYLQQDAETTKVKSYDSRDISVLEPLVEYVYEESSGGSHLKFNDGFQEYSIQDCVETEISQESENTDDGENGNQTKRLDYRIEPMMPFFLTSPVVTIMDENNEVGETIILQIESENVEEQEEEINYEIQTDNSMWDSNLCTPKDNTVTNTFSCELCLIPYGCLNCLKSHYVSTHMAQNSVAQYKLACDICGSGFDRQSYLSEHLKSVHSKGDFGTFYDCELCKQSYHYAGNLSKHYQAFHKMVMCIICKTKFENAKDLQEHEKEHWQKNVLPYACSKCDKAFSDISDIAVHIRQDHNHKRKVENLVAVHRKVIDNEQRPNKKVKVKKLDKSSYLQSL